MSSKRKYALVDLVDGIGLLDLSEEELIDQGYSIGGPRSESGPFKCSFRTLSGW